MTEPIVPTVFTLTREDQKRRDGGLSASLQVGKAAEHLVCADLILQGLNAFIADAGQPYDLLVDAAHGRFFRVQVKATCRVYERRNTRYPSVYRFAVRSSRGSHGRRVGSEHCDVVALVAINTRQVAYIPIQELDRDGLIVSIIEMKTRRQEYPKPGCRGKDPNKFGRFMEDYTVFPFLTAIIPPPKA